MDNPTNLAKFVQDYGITTILVVFIIWLAWKYVPKIIELWVQGQNDQRASLLAKQKVYDEQNAILIEMVKQSTAVIAQNAAVIERNNLIIEQSVKLNDKVLTSLEGTVNSIELLRADLESHDKRAERMNLDVIRLYELTRNMLSKQDFTVN